MGLGPRTTCDHHRGGVTVRTKTSPSPSSLTVGISHRVWCSHGRIAPVTVTFSDPSGSMSVSLEPFASCRAALWGESRQSGRQLDFGIEDVKEGISPQVGFRVEVNEPEELVAGENVAAAKVPFFYAVSGPSGIIAQSAMTAIERRRVYDEPINANTAISSRNTENCIAWTLSPQKGRGYSALAQAVGRQPQPPSLLLRPEYPSESFRVQ